RLHFLGLDHAHDGDIAARTLAEIKADIDGALGAVEPRQEIATLLLEPIVDVVVVELGQVERIADGVAEIVGGVLLPALETGAISGRAGEHDGKALGLQTVLVVAQHLEARAALRQLVVDEEDLAFDGPEAVAVPVAGMFGRELTVDDLRLIVFLHAVADDLRT